MLVEFSHAMGLAEVSERRRKGVVAAGGFTGSLGGPTPSSLEASLRAPCPVLRAPCYMVPGKPTALSGRALWACGWPIA